MPFKLLDPTLDITFKLLLLRNPLLLRDMIESVLEPPRPIRDLVVQNPEIPTDFPADKTIVLDIRVSLDDGRQIDLEMQSTVPPGTLAHFLYYWAKAFSEAFAAGEDYFELRPFISILWFRQAILDSPRFHSVFHLREDNGTEVFSEEIEFHVMELPKLGLATAERQAKLERWARFLRARTSEELEQLAQEDEIMVTAKHALEELSSDKDAQRLARERETAVLVHRHLLGASFHEGKGEGRTEGIEVGFSIGLAEGHAGGLRLAVATACQLLGIDLDTTKKDRLAQLDADGPNRLLECLKSARRWPEGI